MMTKRMPSILLCLWTWQLGVPAVVHPAPTLAQLAEAIDSPTIGGEVTLSSPLRLVHGTIDLKPGARGFQLLAEGIPCGLYIQGPSTFTYRVDNPISIPVARRNFDRVTKLEPKDRDGGLEVVEELESVVIWSWALSDEPAPLKGTEGSVALPERVTEVFDRPLFGRPSRDLLVTRGLGAGACFYVFLQGRRHDWILDAEVHTARRVSLSVVDKVRNSLPDLNGRHTAQTIATEPLAREWWDDYPDALIAVKESISVDNPSETRVIVKTEVELQASQDGVGLWAARLVSETWVRSERLTEMKVSSVQVDGQAADFVHRDDSLLIALPRVLSRGETVTVSVVNEGELAVRWDGDRFWSLGTWSWYPKPERNGELATVDLTVRIPADFTPFASGKVVSETEVDGFKVLRTRIEKPVRFPVVAAGKYTVYSDTRGGVTCRVATYASKNEKAARRLIDTFFRAAEFYEQVFGFAYPFDSLTVIEINDWGFGQAPPGVIFITQEAFSPMSSDFSQRMSRGVNERYLHEIAHTWWGQIVKWPSPEEQWLSEGFATYSAALCLEVMHGAGKRGLREFNDSLRKWQANADRVGKGGSVFLANFIAYEGTPDLSDRRYLLYFKGALVLHALRQKLAKDMGGQRDGDRLFFGVLRSLVHRAPFQWSGTGDLIAILGDATGKDWKPWFDRFVFGSEMPEVTISN